MISYSEALDLVLAEPLKLAAETVEVAKAHWRFLAREVRAPLPLPRFDNSSVDGYAFPSLGPERRFRIVNVSAAGDANFSHVLPGQCWRVFTGAPVPPGTYGVAMQEDVRIDGDWAEPGDVHEGQFIRRAGEEFKAGDVILSAGGLLTPAATALAASVVSEVEVSRLPRVALLITGSEIARHGDELEAGQIFESNSFAISAALSRLRITPWSVQFVGDDRTETIAAVRGAIENCDILIVTGGVSVGDRDFVKFAFEECGVAQVFWRAALKPGKPVYFGRLPEKAVFGLPGNPMSALVTYTLLVEPFLKAGMGALEPEPCRISTTILEDFRHAPGRTEFVPGVFEESGVRPIQGQGSHMLGGLARANALIDIPSDCELVPAGSVIHAIPFGVN
ncbi:MAG TPA: gephyrin-like molybdotransferase Glp [Fimbriimonadales bacterium]|nr:gephyrin-like molybdotransferase Glp [Fimbriimonadales bacterium]